MRLFQRAFKRAGYPLTHTHGYNPRPSVSIALPLSVGIESQCELLDFDLDTECDALDNLRDKLNAALTAGVFVREVMSEGRKIRDLAYLKTRIRLHYDNGIPSNACAAIEALFSGASLIVSKKTKSGVQDQDILQMIQTLTVESSDDKIIEITAVHCCQNPTLNPTQIVAAISKYAPDLMPDACEYRRMEVYDGGNNIFR
jgi:radical SAM-linked protein